MKFSFQHTRIAPEQYKEYQEKVRPHLTSLQEIVSKGEYGAPESSLLLSTDLTVRNYVRELVQEKASQVKLVVLVGIGGSNLGTEAIYRACKGPEHKEMFFLETTDDESLEKLRGLVEGLSSPEEVIVSVVSKSGETVETLANADILLDMLREKFGREVSLERFVVITNKDSELWRTAEENAVAVLEIPFAVGGRYSVLSSVGLFPLACAGFDVDELHRGASAIQSACLSEESPAVYSSAFLVHLYAEGYTIHDTFLFDPSLEKLGMWYRQLLAESIGKRNNTAGEEVRAGITPTVSIGSRDLHSVLQLTLGGPRDKTATFVTTSAEREGFVVPDNSLFSSRESNLVGKSPARIMEALQHGAKGAYREAEVPFMEAFFTEKKVTLFEIGEFLQWKMIEVMLIAHLFNINGFNQDAIELYKNITKRALAGGI